jgi:hypothetical protein
MPKILRSSGAKNDGERTTTIFMIQPAFRETFSLMSICQAPTIGSIAIFYNKKLKKVMGK